MIRPATAADVATIAVIEAECFGSTAWSEQLIREHLAVDHHLVFMHDYVAYASIAVRGDVADLDRIAVLPLARRQGVAGALMDQLIAAAGKAGAERMLLEVAADNEAAIGLYESYGFATISTRKGYYAGVDAHIMELHVTLGA
jgi:ribosomal-protein-alanine N-acetyltransferase